MKLKSDPRLLVGFEQAADAGVYQVSRSLALVQTVDFFTPMVDDPFTFGQIAACNALSDVYAMGGTPLTALNIVCFPARRTDLAVLERILQGGLHILDQAATLLVGGHSVDDPEIKYGLSVTGQVRPDRLITNRNARPGDRLILTKPLGTGIITTALKGRQAPADAVTTATRSMTTLNRVAAKQMARSGVHACTDVTGFGLAGHACEMMCASRVSCTLYHHRLPLLPHAMDLVNAGMVPGGTARNRDYFGPSIGRPQGLDRVCESIWFDPQTSGGLLIACPAQKADALLTALRKDASAAAIIGEVTPRRKHLISFVS